MRRTDRQRRRWVPWLALIAAVGLDTAAQAAGVSSLPPASRRFAILVGVDSYANKNITSLSDPSNDVRALQSALIQYGGFPDENVIVLSTRKGDGASGGDPRDQPTKARILTALSSLKRKITEDSLLLFMFSGHGIARQGRAFLLTQEAELTDDVDLLEDTSLSVDLLTQRIADTHARQAIVLMDACRNDPEADKGLADNKLSESFATGFDFSRKNTGIQASAVVFATELSYRAYVDSGQQIAYFTETLVEALSGRAADQNGDITLGRLLQYVQTEVPKRVADAMPGKRQRPIFTLSGYLPENLVVAHTTASIQLARREPPPRSSGNEEHAAASQWLPLQNAELDYPRLFRSTAGEQELSKLGEAAFVRGNYDWSIKFFEQAHAVQTSKVWMQHYPQLAVSYLLGANDEDKFRSTLAEMTDQMTIPHTYLSNPVTIGFTLDELDSVRKLVPNSDKAVLDDAARRAQSIQASLRDKNLVQSGHVRLRDCWVDGQNCGFQFAVGKVVPIYPADGVTTGDIFLMNQTDQTHTSTQSPAMLFAPNDSPPYAGGGDVGARGGVAVLTTLKVEDSVTVPMSAYRPHWNPVAVGHVYSILTRDGVHSARIMVTSLTNKSIDFDWVYDPQRAR